jgi:hypothetical protein
MHPLSQVSIRGGWYRGDTYNPPSKKTNISVIFCFLGNCRFMSTGIGKIRTAISVANWNDAMVYHSG